MTHLVLVSRNAAMRDLLALITKDAGYEVSVFPLPELALPTLQATVFPTIVLMDVWLDAWDARAQAFLQHFINLPMRHVSIVLWDAQIPLPQKVRAQMRALEIILVKKLEQLDGLDAALQKARMLLHSRYPNIDDGQPTDDGPSALVF